MKQNLILNKESMTKRKLLLLRRTRSLLLYLVYLYKAQSLYYGLFNKIIIILE